MADHPAVRVLVVSSDEVRRPPAARTADADRSVADGNCEFVQRLVQARSRRVLASLRVPLRDAVASYPAEVTDTTPVDVARNALHEPGRGTGPSRTSHPYECDFVLQRIGYDRHAASACRWNRRADDMGSDRDPAHGIDRDGWLLDGIVDQGSVV